MLLETFLFHFTVFVRNGGPLKPATMKIRRPADKEVLVDLQPHEKKALQVQARRFGVTPSEFVRIALGQYLIGPLIPKEHAKKGMVARTIE